MKVSSRKQSSTWLVVLAMLALVGGSLCLQGCGKSKTTVTGGQSSS